MKIAIVAVIVAVVAAGVAAFALSKTKISSGALLRWKTKTHASSSSFALM
jgi:hypothetical protein